MLESLINWIESHQQACFYKKYLGIECPGCGMQRSFIKMLKGNFIESITLFPALIPMILLIFILIIHLIFKLKNGAVMLKILFIINISIVVLSYIYKLLI